MLRLARFSPLLLLAAASDCGPTAREIGASGLATAGFAFVAALLVVAWLNWLHRAGAPLYGRANVGVISLALTAAALAIGVSQPHDVMWEAALLFGAGTGASYATALGVVLVRTRPRWLGHVPWALWLVTLLLSAWPVVTNAKGSEEALLYWVGLPWMQWVSIGAGVGLVVDLVWTLWQRRANASAEVA